MLAPRPNRPSAKLERVSPSESRVLLARLSSTLRPFLSGIFAGKVIASILALFFRSTAQLADDDLATVYTASLIARERVTQPRLGVRFLERWARGSDPSGRAVMDFANSRGPRFGMPNSRPRFRISGNRPARLVASHPPLVLRVRVEEKRNEAV